jgi:predicted TIM-barrel enzyme
VIVSGIATGQPADAAEVQSVARAVSVPTLVGSGVTPANCDDYLDADALIVGSFVKHGGVWSGPIDESRAGELARAFSRK